MGFKKMVFKKKNAKPARGLGPEKIMELLIEHYDEWAGNVAELDANEKETLGKEFEAVCSGSGDAVLET